MPSLKRLSDGAGDSGGSSIAFKIVDGKMEVVGNYPIVGAFMQVGAMTARTYSAQDFWRTNEVTEILEDKMVKLEGCDEEVRTVKFMTKSGSIYEWKE